LSITQGAPPEAIPLSGSFGWLGASVERNSLPPL
jgi:hypothetical protein